MNNICILCVNKNMTQHFLPIILDCQMLLKQNICQQSSCGTKLGYLKYTVVYHWVEIFGCVNIGIQDIIDIFCKSPENVW